MTSLSIGASYGSVLVPERRSFVQRATTRLVRRPLVLALALYLIVDLAYFGARTIPEIGHTCACRAGADPTTYMWFLAWWPHAAPVLAAFFAFLLCRYVSGSVFAGLVGGYIYGFSPYMLGHMQGHLDLVMIFPIPAAVLLTLALIDRRISRRAYVPLMALTFGFLLLSQPELTLTFVLLGACAFVVALVLAPGERARISAAIVPVLAAGAIAAVVTSVFIYYALTGPVSNGFFNGYSGTYVADALGFIVPTPIVRLGRGWFSVVSNTFTGSTPEDGVYVGLVLALVLARNAITRWGRVATRILLVMLAVIVVLMLGPRMHVAGNPTVPLPWGGLDHLPLLVHAAPVRMAPYMFLIVAVIVALWLGQPRSGRWGAAKWVVAFLGLVLLVPNLSSGSWHSRFDNPPLFTTSAYRSVIRPGSIVLPLPFAQWGESMLWQAETGFSFRMADGYVGALLPSGYAHDLGVLSSPQIQPKPSAFAAFLAARHVSTVIVGAHDPGTWPRVLAVLGLHPKAIDGTLVYSLPSSDAVPTPP